MATLTEREKRRVENKLSQLFGSIERTELRLERIGSDHEDSEELSELLARWRYGLLKMHEIVDTLGFFIDYNSEEDEYGNTSYSVKLTERVKH